MKRIAGVLLLLVAMYAALFAADPNAGEAGNLIAVANRQGYLGVLTLGAGLLILSGAIDLSMGSVVALGAVAFALLLKRGVNPYAAVLTTVSLGAAVGLVHGALVRGLRLQAFLVTLCGMFVWRGAARLLTGGGEVGLSESLAKHPESAAAVAQLQWLLVGLNEREKLVYPAMLAAFGVIALALALVLHRTAHGRYWYAIGSSEAAAEYAGVKVARYRVWPFVISSALSALCGVLLILEQGTAKSDNAAVGSELFAITGAVLGGVGLRGGEGSVLGMALGAAVLPLLQNLVIFYGIGDNSIPVVVGLTLLLGSVADEQIRRREARRRG